MKQKIRIGLLLFSVFLIWRLLLLLPLLVGDSILVYRNGYDYTSIWKYTQPYFPVSLSWVHPWANFDGVYYLSIASNGYTIDNTGFFPLFPLLIHAVSFPFGQGTPYGIVQFSIALFAVHAVFFLSMIVLYKLLNIDYKKPVAIASILFLLLFPTSFFFVSIYTEGLFLLFVLLTFYFARKKQWLQASIFGMLLGATRIVGIAVFPALLVEFFIQEKTIWKRQALSFFLIPSGLIAYALFNFFQWGDALHFLRVHGNLGNSRSVDSIILFPQTVFRYIKILFSVSPSLYEWWIAALELTTFFFIGFLLYIAWKKRVRFSYLIFAFLGLLLPASSGTFTGLPRYCAILFPIFITLALVTKKWIHILYVVIASILLFLLLMLFSRGYYVS